MKKIESRISDDAYQKIKESGETFYNFTQKAIYEKLENDKQKNMLKDLQKAFLEDTKKVLLEQNQQMRSGIFGICTVYRQFIKNFKGLKI